MKLFAGFEELFSAAGRLKDVARAGWGMRGAPDAESVADHSYRMSVMALALAGHLGADPGKLVAMCLLHDLAEADVGDITPSDGVLPEEKRAREEAAMRRILDGAPGGDALLAIWLEYEEGASAEARAARLLDKLEMALQAAEYQKRYPELDFSEFLESARKLFNTLD